MSEFTTTQDILEMIEANGGPQGLDLSGKNLSGIDLSRDTIQRLAKERGDPPPWLSSDREGINLREAHLDGTDLSSADLDGADFTLAHLEGAELTGACLQSAKLWGAHLEDAYLVGVNLNGASLVESHLENADLSLCDLEGAHFDSAHLDRTRMDRRCFGNGIGVELGEWKLAEEAYIGLKQNFVSLGRYEDASWAYVKERQMERNAAFPSEAGDQWVKERLDALPAWLRRSMPTFTRWLLAARLLLWPWSPPGVALDRPKWLRNTVWWLLCNYGESVFRPLAWGVAIVAAFGLLYVWSSGVKMESGLPPSDIADYFIFSGRCFATMSFNDLQPAGLWGRLLSAVEGMLGVSTLALFMYCLGRRMSGR